LDNFSPRFGLAYSPNVSNGFLGALNGGPGKTSIRLGGGRFVTSPQGLTVAYPTGNPPYDDVSNLSWSIVESAME
jgi:hypothetical protein